MNYLLIVAALLPAIMLCAYVYKKDRREKEPIKLLLFLFFAGVVCCLPAIILEDWLIGIINSLFLWEVAEDGMSYVPGMAFYLYNFLVYFIGVALVEEYLKWISLIYITKNNKNYNSFYDGMIYAVFVSLGFAALENVMYVIESGWYVACLRAVLSVPAHMFFAVIMGYNYSLWNIYEKASEMEGELAYQGIICVARPFIPERKKWNSLLVPILAHGFYDYCCMIKSTSAVFAFFAFVVFLYIYCFKKIRTMSDGDVADSTYAKNLISKKYSSDVFEKLNEDEAIYNW